MRRGQRLISQLPNSFKLPDPPEYRTPVILHLSDYKIARFPNYKILWIQPVQHSWKRNRFAHVLEPADPCDRPLDPHPEAAVRNAAELPQVEIPLERFLGQIVFANSLQQQIVGSHTLRAADDFAVAFRRQHVDTQRQVRTQRIGLHIKRLHLRRITMNHERPFELRRKIGFIRRAKVPTPFKLAFESTLREAFLQSLYSLVVGDSRERRIDLFEFGYVAANGLQVHAALFQAALHDGRDEVLRQFHQVVEVRISNLRLDHPELSQMSASLRFFRAERRSERIDLAQRHRRRFDIELPGLREERLFLKIVDGKQRRRPFASCGSNDRWIGQSEAAVVKEVARRLDDLRTHAQNRRLPR